MTASMKRCGSPEAAFLLRMPWTISARPETCARPTCAQPPVRVNWHAAATGSPRKLASQSAGAGGMTLLYSTSSQRSGIALERSMTA